MLTHLDVHLSSPRSGLAKPTFAGSVAAGSSELAPALWRNGWPARRTLARLCGPTGSISSKPDATNNSPRRRWKDQTGQ
jgi:hypothetical protein